MVIAWLAEYIFQIKTKQKHSYCNRAIEILYNSYSTLCHSATPSSNVSLSWFLSGQVIDRQASDRPDAVILTQYGLVGHSQTLMEG